MGRCYCISIRLATKVVSLMAQVLCYFPQVFAPNSVQLCIVSTEAPGPITVKKYTRWWRILEWIAWFNGRIPKSIVINEGVIIRVCSQCAFDEYNAICNGITFVNKITHVEQYHPIGWHLDLQWPVCRAYISIPWKSNTVTNDDHENLAVLY